MTIEELIKFLEHEKLKDVLYKKLNWQDDYIPVYYTEVGRLLNEFGKQRVAFFLNGDVAYYVNRKETISWQVGSLIFSFWVGSVIFNLTKKKRLLALSSFSILSVISWYTWLPCLLELYFAKKIKDYISVYKEEVILNNQIDEGYLSYIESIRGLMNSAEFELHVTYLKGISSEAMEECKKYLFTTILTKHIEVRRKFLAYVEALRSGEITNDDFEFHVSRFREYSSIEINREEKYKHGLLLSEVKKLFWRLNPSCQQENSSIEHLYKALSSINYEEATLMEVLKPLGLLAIIGDGAYYNVELICTIKQMLLQYHPDKNKHGRAEALFTLINENVNNPVSVIFEDFEKYTNCSFTKCNLDEFLAWRVEKIKRIREKERRSFFSNSAVYKHLLFQSELKGNFSYSALDERWLKERRPDSEFTMEYYWGDKRNILKKKDEILVEYRTLSETYVTLKQKELLCRKKLQDVKKIGNVEERRIKKEEIADLSDVIKDNKEEVVKVEKSIKNKKEEMKVLVEWLMRLYDPMIEKYERVIDYLSDYLQDASRGKIRGRYECYREYFDEHRDQEQMSEYKRKTRKQKLSTFVDERRMRIYKRRVVEFREDKERMEALLTYLSKEVPVDRMDQIKYFMTDAKDKARSELIGLVSKVCPIFDHYSNNERGLVHEYVSISKEYEHLKRELVKSEVINGNDIVSLITKCGDLKNKFKVEKEKTEKLNDKEDKKKLLITRKRVQEMKTEIIEVKQDTEKKDVELMKERKARQEAEKARQEAKQEAERISQEAKQEAERIRQEAKQEAERISQEKDAYKNLLLKIQKGELPISALDNIDIESFASLIAGPSSSFAKME